MGIRSSKEQSKSVRPSLQQHGGYASKSSRKRDGTGNTAASPWQTYLRQQRSLLEASQPDISYRQVIPWAGAEDQVNDAKHVKDRRSRLINRRWHMPTLLST